MEDGRKMPAEERVHFYILQDISTTSEEQHALRDGVREEVYKFYREDFDKIDCGFFAQDFFPSDRVMTPTHIKNSCRRSEKALGGLRLEKPYADFTDVSKAIREAAKAIDGERSDTFADQGSSHTDLIFLMTDGVNDTSGHNLVCPNSEVEIVTQDLVDSFSKLSESASGGGNDTWMLLILTSSEGCGEDISRLWRKKIAGLELSIVIVESWTSIQDHVQKFVSQAFNAHHFDIEPNGDVGDEERSKMDSGSRFEVDFKVTRRKVRGAVGTRVAEISKGNLYRIDDGDVVRKGAISVEVYGRLSSEDQGKSGTMKPSIVLRTPLEKEVKDISRFNVKVRDGSEEKVDRKQSYYLELLPENSPRMIQDPLVLYPTRKIREDQAWRLFRLGLYVFWLTLLCAFGTFLVEYFGLFGSDKKDPIAYYVIMNVLASLSLFIGVQYVFEFFRQDFRFSHYRLLSLLVIVGFALCYASSGSEELKRVGGWTRKHILDWFAKVLPLNSD